MIFFCGGSILGDRHDVIARDMVGVEWRTKDRR